MNFSKKKKALLKHKLYSVAVSWPHLTRQFVNFNEAVGRQMINPTPPLQQQPWRVTSSPRVTPWFCKCVATLAATCPRKNQLWILQVFLRIWKGGESDSFHTESVQAIAWFYRSCILREQEVHHSCEEMLHGCEHMLTLFSQVYLPGEKKLQKMAITNRKANGT